MKLITKLSIVGLFVISAFVSNAQGINFQGVARSANGTIIASSNISLRLSIISKNVDATPEYVETKTVVTNAQGIFTVVVGDATNATVVGSFKTINWAESPKFLKVEMDPSAGTNYINMGATQLQYVPYSFYSFGVAAENVTGVLPVTKGGTGVGSIANFKAALALDKVNNTSDLEKPISAKTQTVIDSLNKRIDSLYAALSIKSFSRIDSLFAGLSIKSLSRIDSSTLKTSNPVIATRFLDSTFLPSINFNGTGTYVNIGTTNLAATVSNSNLTFEFWIKNSLTTNQNQTIFSTGYDMQGQGINVKLSSSVLTFSFHNFNHQIAINYPNDSLWHHVAYTNKNRVSIIYLDGVEKMRANNTGLEISSSQRLAIGATIMGASPSDFYKGSLRKMRISKGANYNATFSPSYTYSRSDSTVVFWDLNDLGTSIKASDSTYNGTLYNGTWAILDTISNVKLNDSLVAYYSFSGNALDSSINGLNGTVNGAVLAADRFGRANNAYSFNTNQYIEIPNSANYNTYPFSVSLWVSLDSLNNSGGNLFKKYSSAMWNGFNLSPSTGASDSTGFIYPFYLTGDGVPNGLIGGYGIPESKFVINRIPTRRWVHISMTVDNTGGKLYMNGNLVDTLDWRTAAKACSNSLNWMIGGSYEANSWFKGKIDDIRVYKRALNLNEVRYLSSH